MRVGLFSQDIKTVRDVGLWTGVGLDYKLNKSYSLNFNQEVRLYNNFNKLEKLISDVGIEYKINKKFGLAFNARYYLNNHKDNTYSNDFRYSFDFDFKKKISESFVFKYRLRYQDTYESLFDKIPEEIINTFRNKIALDYLLKNEDKLYFKAEIFRKRPVYKKAYFSKIRLGLGIEQPTKLGEINYGVAYERELGETYPLNFFFFRINYKFKIKR